MTTEDEGVAAPEGASNRATDCLSETPAGLQAPGPLPPDRRCEDDLTNALLSIYNGGHDAAAARKAMDALVKVAPWPLCRCRWQDGASACPMEGSLRGEIVSGQLGVKPPRRKGSR